MTAGLSVGMSKWQTLRHVILPQAYRIVIPAWTNEFCSLTKSSSVLAYVGISFFASGISDLTSVGIAVSYQQFVILPVWIVIGLIYLAWITGFSKIMDTIYEKKKIPGIDLEIQS
jgi:polar amino acid transport system permease protein